MSTSCHIPGSPATGCSEHSSRATTLRGRFQLPAWYKKLAKVRGFAKRRPQFNWWAGKADGNTAVPFRRTLSSIERGGYGAAGTQLILLSAASQRDVRGVELPANVNVEARKVVDTQ